MAVDIALAHLHAALPTKKGRRNATNTKPHPSTGAGINRDLSRIVSAKSEAQYGPNGSTPVDPSNRS